MTNLRPNERLYHLGNHSIPYYGVEGSDPEYDQGHSVTVWYDDLYNLSRDYIRLRAALVALVGADGKEDLQQMELVLRSAPAPAEDKVAAIDAIHILLETAP